MFCLESLYLVVFLYYLVFLTTIIFYLSFYVYIPAQILLQLSTLEHLINEFTILRELLDGRLSGSDEKDILQSIKPLELKFIVGAKEAQCRVSPNGLCVAICATQSGWFGMNRREIGFIISRNGTMRAMGSYVIGNVVQRHWMPLAH